MEAAAGGALASIQLIANIAASLIAFLAALRFVNETLTWFGHRAGMSQPLTFQLLCSYVLWPLAFVMGVATPDCGRVGELIGVKTFLNEYIAYTELGKLPLCKVGKSLLQVKLNLKFTKGLLAIQ